LVPPEVRFVLLVSFAHYYSHHGSSSHNYGVTTRAIWTHLKPSERKNSINLQNVFPMKEDSEGNLESAVLDLLVEDAQTNAIRTLHPLVANSILRLFDFASPEALMRLAETFCDITWEPDPQSPIFSVFLRRHTDDVEHFAPFILYLHDVRLADKMFKALVAAFPDNAHFVAHLGRYYSEKLHEAALAQNTFERALQMSEENDSGTGFSFLFTHSQFLILLVLVRDFNDGGEPLSTFGGGSRRTKR
jgi:hypothetical protein